MGHRPSARFPRRRRRGRPPHPSDPAQRRAVPLVGREAPGDPGAGRQDPKPASTAAARTGARPTQGGAGPWGLERHRAHERGSALRLRHLQPGQGVQARPSHRRREGQGRRVLRPSVGPPCGRDRGPVCQRTERGRRLRRNGLGGRRHPRDQRHCRLGRCTGAVHEQAELPGPLAHDASIRRRGLGDRRRRSGAHSPHVARGRRPQHWLCVRSVPTSCARWLMAPPPARSRLEPDWPRWLQVIRKCWGRLAGAGAGTELATYSLRRVCRATGTESLSFRSTPRNFGEGLGLAPAAGVQGLWHRQKQSKKRPAGQSPRAWVGDRSAYRRRRSKAAHPARPAPSNSTLEGSGTLTGGVSTSSAPLFAVATVGFVQPLPQKPTMYEPTGSPANTLKRGVCVAGGLSAMVCTPKSAVNTLNPVAPGSSPWVVGKYAPIGLFGEGPGEIPKNVPKSPLVHVPACCVAVKVTAGVGDVFVICSGDGALWLFGTKTSRTRSPV